MIKELLSVGLLSFNLANSPIQKVSQQSNAGMTSLLVLNNASQLEYKDGYFTTYFVDNSVHQSGYYELTASSITETETQNFMSLNAYRSDFRFVSGTRNSYAPSNRYTIELNFTCPSDYSYTNLQQTSYVVSSSCVDVKGTGGDDFVQQCNVVVSTLKEDTNFKITLDYTFSTVAFDIDIVDQLPLYFSSAPSTDNYDVVDIPGLMFTILTLPFTFFSQAFNLTLFPGTPYQLNFADIIYIIIGGCALLFIIKTIMSLKG